MKNKFLEGKLQDKNTHKKLLDVGTDSPVQTVQTQIKLLLNEQSGQGLHCLLSHLNTAFKNLTVLFLYNYVNSRVLNVPIYGISKHLG